MRYSPEESHFSPCRMKLTYVTSAWLGWTGDVGSCSYGCVASAFILALLGVASCFSARALVWRSESASSCSSRQPCPVQLQHDAHMDAHTRSCSSVDIQICD